MIEKKKKSRVIESYFLRYTVLYLFIAFFVYGLFWRNGRSIIFDDDSFKQHFRSLIYYGKYLRTIFRTIFFQHSLDIPKYSFSVGYGSDILTAFNYYAIGDPLNLPAAVIPVKYLMYYYSFLVVLRSYLSGLSFSAYCMYRKNSSKNGVLAGALSFAFCGYALFGATKHPFFGNALIYFPLLLLGVERVYKERKPLVFIASVALSAISNFYFFYMLVMGTIIYVLIRSGVRYEKGTLGKEIKEILSFALYGITGVLISAVVMVPVLIVFLGSPRTDVDYVYSILYEKAYYQNFLSSLLTSNGPGYWVFFGYPCLSILTMLLLFFDRKRDKALRRTFLFTTALLLIPAAGKILNGFSYVTNRWVWAYSFLFAYVLAVKWDDLKKIPVRYLGMLFVGMTVLYIVCAGQLTSWATQRELFFSILSGIGSLALLFLWRFADTKWQRPTEMLLVLGMAFNLLVLGHYTIAGRLDNFKTYESVSRDLLRTEGEAVKEVHDTGEFYRYCGNVYNTKNSNSSLISGMSSPQTYWSMTDTRFSDLVQEMGMNQRFADNMKNLEGRAALNVLSGVKYYVVKPGKEAKRYLPYGYTQKCEVDGVMAGAYDVYTTPYALPLGYAYTTCLSRDTYEDLNEIDREDAMLHAAVLEELPQGETEAELSLVSKSLPFEVECKSKNVTQQGNSFVVTKKNVTVVLHFQGAADSETFLRFTNFQFKGTRGIDLFNDDLSIDPLNLYNEEKWESLSTAKQAKYIKKGEKWTAPARTNLTFVAGNDESALHTENFQYLTNYDKYYWNRHDYAFHLGYDEAPVTYIKITFEKLGIYSFDQMEVICRSMEPFATKVEALQEQVLTNVDMHNQNSAWATSEVTGEITMKEKGLLCMTIPYSVGWQVFVDGQEKELMRTNTIFSGVMLEPGTHQIRMRYHTPGKKAGWLLSLSGLLLTAAILWYEKKHRRAAQ